MAYVAKSLPSLVKGEHRIPLVTDEEVGINNVSVFVK